MDTLFQTKNFDCKHNLSTVDEDIHRRVDNQIRAIEDDFNKGLFLVCDELGKVYQPLFKFDIVTNFV